MSSLSPAVNQASPAQPSEGILPRASPLRSHENGQSPGSAASSVHVSDDPLGQRTASSPPTGSASGLPPGGEPLENKPSSSDTLEALSSDNSVLLRTTVLALADKNRGLVAIVKELTEALKTAGSSVGTAEKERELAEREAKIKEGEEFLVAQRAELERYGEELEAEFDHIEADRQALSVLASSVGRGPEHLKDSSDAELAFGGLARGGRSAAHLTGGPGVPSRESSVAESTSAASDGAGSDGPAEDVLGRSTGGLATRVLLLEEHLAVAQEELAVVSSNAEKRLHEYVLEVEVLRRELAQSRRQFAGAANSAADSFAHASVSLAQAVSHIDAMDGASSSSGRVRTVGSNSALTAPLVDTPSPSPIAAAAPVSSIGNANDDRPIAASTAASISSHLSTNPVPFDHVSQLEAEVIAWRSRAGALIAAGVAAEEASSRKSIEASWASRALSAAGMFANRMAALAAAADRHARRSARLAGGASIPEASIVPVSRSVSESRLKHDEVEAASRIKSLLNDLQATRGEGPRFNSLINRFVADFAAYRTTVLSLHDKYLSDRSKILSLESELQASRLEPTPMLGHSHNVKRSTPTAVPVTERSSPSRAGVTAGAASRTPRSALLSRTVPTSTLSSPSGFGGIDVGATTGADKLLAYCSKASPFEDANPVTSAVSMWRQQRELKSTNSLLSPSSGLRSSQHRNHNGRLGTHRAPLHSKSSKDTNLTALLSDIRRMREDD